MLHFILYFLTSYACIAIVTYTLFFSKHRMKAGWGQIIVLSLLTLLPIVPYVVVEAQTVLLRASLLPPTQQALREIGFSDRIQKFKVLVVWPGSARVYAVTPCMPYESNTVERRAIILPMRRKG